MIDTFKVSYNAQFGPNNNTALLLYKGFSNPIKLKKLGGVDDIDEKWYKR